MKTFPGARARGSALLLALLLLLLAASATLVSTGRLYRQAQQRADKRGLAALDEARTALLGYALSYPEHHPWQGMGYLPCPDKENDGSATSPCNARDHGALGRLPYRTLGLPIPRDAHGQCLWYAVAGHFKSGPKTLTLNWDSPGQFHIVDLDGRPVSSEGPGNPPDIVAVILAPMAPLPGQIRPPITANTTDSKRCPGRGGPTGADNAADLPAFLDRPYGVDLVGPTTFVQGRPGSDSNDILAWITVDDVFNTLRHRPDLPDTFNTVLDIAAQALQAKLDAPAPTTLPAFLTAHADTVIGLRAHGRLPSATPIGLSKKPSDDPDSERHNYHYDLYNNWHDQLRFVLCTDSSACLTATLIDPATAESDAEASTTTETCRALLLFGGERLRGPHPQQRRTDAERANPAQYLEGTNLTSFTLGTGDYLGYRRYAAPDPRQPASEDLIRCLP